MLSVCISPSWLKCVSIPWGPGTEQTSLALMKVLHLFTSTRWPPTSFCQKAEIYTEMFYRNIYKAQLQSSLYASRSRNMFHCFGSVHNILKWNTGNKMRFKCFIPTKARQSRFFSDKSEIFLISQVSHITSMNTIRCAICWSPDWNKNEVKMAAVGARWSTGYGRN